MASPFKSEEFEVSSGGAADPRIVSGEVDPSAGAGRAAPQGSVYLRYLVAGGEAWLKVGAGDTDWTQIISGSSPSTMERTASFGVAVGTSSQEATLGRVVYSGSLISLSVHAEDATTAGTLTITVKVNGVVKLSAVLDSATNTESNFSTAVMGTHVVAQNDEVTVEVVGSGTYDNALGGTTGLVVNAAMTATGIV